MTIQVGILGLGMMGKCHHDTYAKIKGIKVAAICDGDDKKRRGDVGVFGKVDMSKYKVYRAAEELLSDPAIDVIDITLPTYLHAPYTIAALQAGKHVICEKPMARTSAEARQMIAVAKKTGQKLFLAHCLRFWPSYVKAREIILSGKYGRVLTARFCRLSPLPAWSWQNWLQDDSKSGRAALDLHIHDADFVQYLFGKPKAVLSLGGGLVKKGYDHITTSYEYDGGRFVTAEGAWEYAPSFPFSMTFSIAMEGATLEMTRDLALAVCPMKGKAQPVKVPKGDGYEYELKHFAECIRRNADSDVIPPESALHSVQLVEAEIASAQSRKPVAVKF